MSPPIVGFTDHAVQTRTCVREIVATSQTDIWKVQPSTFAPTPKPKSCVGGMCRHRADCSDVYCPVRLIPLTA